jgi:hypothetical protein
VRLINEDQGRGVNRRVYSHAYVKSLEVIRVEKIPFFFSFTIIRRGKGDVGETEKPEMLRDTRDRLCTTRSKRGWGECLRRKEKPGTESVARVLSTRRSPPVDVERRPSYWVRSEGRKGKRKTSF